MKKKLTIGLLTIMLLLVGCGADSTNDSSAINEIKQSYENGNLAVDYADAVSFEQALNDGEKVNGKIVQFDVVEYKPDSALGINCWAGEHLNFISENELDVSVGDVIVGYVTKEASKTLGSWKIPYEVLEIQSGSTTRDIVEIEDNNIPEESQTVEESIEDKTESVIDDSNLVTEEIKPAYNITDTTDTMYAASTANVRTEPDKNSEKIGTLSQNDEIAITGIVDNGWYRVNYNGSEGYIKGDLLSKEKIVAQETATNNNDGTGSLDNGGSGVTVPTAGDTQGDLVWIPTNGGTKYHSKSSCSDMDNPMQVTREHAEANGFTPCKRCH